MEVGRGWRRDRARHRSTVDPSGQYAHPTGSIRSHHVEQPKLSGWHVAPCVEPAAGFVGKISSSSIGLYGRLHKHQPITGAFATSARLPSRWAWSVGRQEEEAGMIGRKVSRFSFGLAIIVAFAASTGVAHAVTCSTVASTVTCTGGAGASVAFQVTH